jgi:hypothetical protein
MIRSRGRKDEGKAGRYRRRVDQARALSLGVLVTSASWQVGWLTSIRDAARSAGIALNMVGGSTTPQTCPACLLADAATALPAVTDSGYIDALLETCFRFEIGLLLPGSPHELRKLAIARPFFAEMGTYVPIGGDDFVSISRDTLRADTLAVQAGARARGLVTKQEVCADPNAYSWPMEVLPRYWLDEELGRIQLRHPRELTRVPERAQVLFCSRLSGHHLTVAALFDEKSKLTWRATITTSRLPGRIGFAETVEAGPAIAIVDRLAPLLPAPIGPVTFEFVEDPEGGVYLQRFFGTLPIHLPLLERAGAPIAAHLLSRGAGALPPPATDQWISGVRMLTYPSPMLLVQP